MLSSAIINHLRFFGFEKPQTKTTALSECCNIIIIKNINIFPILNSWSMREKQKAVAISVLIGKSIIVRSVVCWRASTIER